MKFQYCSDLHLEFHKNNLWCMWHPLIPSADTLLLAGDIMMLDILKHREYFLDHLSANFKTVYWVPGNHEYYEYDIATKPSSFIEDLRPNVHLVNNQHIIHNGVNLIFSTLWSNISPENEWILQRVLADFQEIKYEKRRLLPSKFTELHLESMRFIESAVNESRDNPSIVVTHHVPTLVNYPPRL